MNSLFKKSIFSSNTATSDSNSKLFNSGNQIQPGSQEQTIFPKKSMWRRFCGAVRTFLSEAAAVVKDVASAVLPVLAVIKSIQTIKHASQDAVSV